MGFVFVSSSILFWFFVSPNLFIRVYKKGQLSVIIAFKNIRYYTIKKQKTKNVSMKHFYNFLKWSFNCKVAFIVINGLGLKLATLSPECPFSSALAGIVAVNLIEMIQKIIE